MSGKHSKKKTNKLIWGIILFILIAILIYSSYQIILWIKSNAELKNLEESVFSEVVTEKTEITENGEEKKVEIDFDQLKQINSEVVGWITIENTNINYPITQAKDNDYYLKRDINKNYSSCGNIFLDCDTKADFTEQNSVIYGHNLKSGGMFANLRKILDGDLGNEVYVKIYTPEKEFTYQVIAAYVAEPTKEIIKKNFTEKEKEQYINNGIKKSKVKFKYDVKSNNNMITLITCYGEQRTVVNALKIN